MAADDVVCALGRIAAGPPLNRVLEVAGPERRRLDQLVQIVLSARSDPREVVADPDARCFGSRLAKHTLMPGEGALLGGTTLEAWLGRQASR